MSHSMKTVDWIEEIDEQAFDAQAFGACTTNIFILSVRGVIFHYSGKPEDSP